MGFCSVEVSRANSAYTEHPMIRALLMQVGNFGFLLNVFNSLREGTDCYPRILWCGTNVQPFVVINGTYCFQTIDWIKPCGNNFKGYNLILFKFISLLIVCLMTK